MRVYVTRVIPKGGLETLQNKGIEVDVNTKEGLLSKEELIGELSKKPYDAIISLLTDTIDADVMNATPRLKIIANYAIGFNNIDSVEAGKRGIAVTNVGKISAEPVAEFTISLMLALSHRIVEADNFVRAGKFRGWEPELLIGSNIHGKTLGILGAGNISQRVAVHAKKGFGMDVIYYDVIRNETFEKEVGVTFFSDADDVISRADFLSIHVPLLESTKHFIHKERLSKMKPSAFLINTSRGAVVDEVALVEALKNNIIRGAALDVFEYEPVLSAGLLNLPNVLLTPHIASSERDARNDMSRIVAENIIALFEGKIPPNKVN
jgi:glyoxylate reductase